AKAAPLDPVAGAAVAIDPEERGLLERLRRLMNEERIYREEGLGIATVAARLGLPEYRLRRLINQRLGHRNFSSFVNGYRLAETIEALSDPAQAQVPVLTIALDAGFQSIGPFNRAFKAQTGMTPTDFRRERLERGAAQAAE
ncbi:MAG: helix-turn-helix domain-containing protein, partial [Stellaceae bacterium]